MADEWRGDINFQKVIFLHLNRILTASGMDKDQYIALVESFWDMMEPYHKNNGIDLGDAKKKYDAVMNLANEYKGKKPALKDAEMNLARAKFRGLMMLAEQRGLLIEESIYGEDEDEI